MKATCQSSGNCMVAMKLCIAVVLCVSAIGYGSVRAAVCPGTKNACTPTDLTSKDCDVTINQCKCVKNGYQPITSGCAVKPVVRLEPGRTTEFFPSSTVKLTCYTPDTKVTFSWKKNGVYVVNNSVTPEYTLPGTDAEKVASYSCVTSEGQVSEDSDPVNITLVVATTGPASPPVVSGIPERAVQFAQIDVECTNIPYGTTYTFQISKGPQTTFLTPGAVTHDITNGNITCVINNTLVANSSNAKSSPTPWTTTDAENIVAVTTDPAGTKYFKPGTAVLVTCVTSPISKYMLANTNPTTLNYSIQDTANLAAVLANNIYNVTPANGTHNITCSASYNNKPNVTSPAVSIVFDENLGVVPPALKANSNEVKLSTSLVLTCTPGNQVDGVSFSWKKDGASIPRQKDRIIQFNNFQDADAGKYVCTANKEAVSLDSKEQVVKSAASGLHVLGSILLVLVALASSKIF